MGAIIKVKKGAAVYQIDETEKQLYLNNGWVVIDNKGKVVEASLTKDQKEIIKLKKEIAKLKKEKSETPVTK